MHLVRRIDGAIMKNKILARWAEYLLIKDQAIDAALQCDLPTLSIILTLDDPPYFDEVGDDILRFKYNRASSTGRIPAEVIKYGG